FTTATTTTSSSSSLTSEESDALSSHNYYRTTLYASYNLPALAWSTSLASEATSYAAHLALDLNCALIHSGAPDEGENLTMYGASAVAAGILTMKQAVEGWMTEDPFQLNHASQVLWRTTTQVGCGKVINFKADGSLCLVVVCRYTPP
ncbi:CAP domain-containing protein, partial [Zopfochytrium polystomum]